MTTLHELLAIIVIFAVGSAAGFGVARHWYGPTEGADQTEYRRIEGRLDPEALDLTRPRLAELFAATTPTIERCIPVPTQLVRDTVYQFIEDPYPQRGDPPPLRYVARPAHEGSEAIDLAAFRYELARSPYRFLYLPLGAEGQPAVQVSRRQTVVSAYVPGEAGRSVRLTYPHPRPSWTLAGTLRSGLLVDELGAWALATVRYKRFELGAGYGTTWTPLEAPTPGPIITLSTRLFNITL